MAPVTTIDNGTPRSRCRRKSAQGDALHVLGCAGGYNLCWPMRWTAFFAGLDPGDGMAILEHRLPITADD
ncbi:IS1478 transposase [Xanthomonas fragariae LMG 25863]|nr:IS1478 transposase [Xanthomonas fragariae LMG 25863]